jgi:hypothetical protein
VQYKIDYQFMPKGAKRPIDEGEIVGIEATDKGGLVLLPNVGDYVAIHNGGMEAERSSFNGKVKTRLFSYNRIGKEIVCIVNIVVEETDDDWGTLIKE